MAYAHTRILKGAKVEATQGSAGQVGTVHDHDYVEINEEVSQEALGVDDRTWEDYYRFGVVGDEKLPDDLSPSEPYNQYKARKAVETLDSLQANQEVPAAARGDLPPQDVQKKQAEEEKK